jgi:hypothetical protein
MPNEQPSTQLFYHDHTMGITWLNLYAVWWDLAYFIRDPKQSSRQAEFPPPKESSRSARHRRPPSSRTGADFPRESDNFNLPYWQAESEANVVVVNARLGRT